MQTISITVQTENAFSIMNIALLKECGNLERSRSINILLLRSEDRFELAGLPIPPSLKTD